MDVLCTALLPVGRESQIMILNPKRPHILGCPVDALNMVETVSVVESEIQNRTPMRHSVVNAAKLVYMQKDDRLRQAIKSANLINADGMSVVWASRFLKQPLTERVTGIDLFWNLLELSEHNYLFLWSFGKP